MGISINPDKEIADTVREGLKRTGGYCPCRREHTEENKCMCREFREQIADPEFEGFCHCMLYYKSKYGSGFFGCAGRAPTISESNRTGSMEEEKWKLF